jgi:hypothetical protein
MLTWEEQALLTSISDRLIELYSERDEAVRVKDFDRAERLRTEIEETSAERRDLLSTEPDRG